LSEGYVLILLHSRHCVNSCSFDAAACFSLSCLIHCVNGEAEGTMQQRKNVALQRLWKRQQNCFYMIRTGCPNFKKWQAAHLPADYIIKAASSSADHSVVRRIRAYIYIHTSGHKKMDDSCGSVESSEKYKND
jgi:hypothetical protein